MIELATTASATIAAAVTVSAAVSVVAAEASVVAAPGSTPASVGACSIGAPSARTTSVGPASGVALPSPLAVAASRREVHLHHRRRGGLAPVGTGRRAALGLRGVDLGGAGLAAHGGPAVVAAGGVDWTHRVSVVPSPSEDATRA